jgi:hypothetical protein
MEIGDPLMTDEGTTPSNNHDQERGKSSQTTFGDGRLLQRVIVFSDEHTELLVSLAFLIVLTIWSLFIPRPWHGYGPEVISGSETAKQSVWRQYSDNFGHFRWGMDLNLYLYSSLRFIAIILSAVTPALIVAPSLKDKKVLAALPAVVVAIATGLIAEFDFKSEAARFDTAQVQLETEKSLFLTHGKPFYAIQTENCLQPLTTNGRTQSKKINKSQAGTSKNSPQSDSCTVSALTLQTDISDVPFPRPKSDDEALSNFAYRIDKIRQAVATERDLFLRGKVPPAIPTANSNQSKS